MIGPTRLCWIASGQPPHEDCLDMTPSVPCWVCGYPTTRGIERKLWLGSMSLGGMFDRAHIRVGTLGGYRGENWGRREHEKEYYPEEMKRLGIWR